MGCISITDRCVKANHASEQLVEMVEAVLEMQLEGFVPSNRCHYKTSSSVWTSHRAVPRTVTKLSCNRSTTGQYNACHGSLAARIYLNNLRIPGPPPMELPTRAAALGRGAEEAALGSVVPQLIRLA